MNVLNVSSATDIGGDGYRTKRAFDRFTDWHYVSIRRADGLYGFPASTPWSEVGPAWERADVVHLRDSFHIEKVLPKLPRRPYVIQHHGSVFRKSHAGLVVQQRQRRAIGLASTLDLYLLAPDDLTWLPAPFNREELAAMRTPVGDGVLRIAHAPTNRDSKSTVPFLAACDRLAREIPVEVVLIERRPYAECLAAKGRADIYFDQVLTGYGNNAIEAWAMGIPVVAGVDHVEAARRGYPVPAGTLDEMRRRFGELPFVLADEGTIYDALRLLAEPSARRAWAERGLAHVRRFHDERVVVSFLQRIYEAAVNGQRIAA